MNNDFNVVFRALPDTPLTAEQKEAVMEAAQKIGLPLEADEINMVRDVWEHSYDGFADEEHTLEFMREAGIDTGGAERAAQANSNSQEIEEDLPDSESIPLAEIMDIEELRDEARLMATAGTPAPPDANKIQGGKVVDNVCRDICGLVQAAEKHGGVPCRKSGQAHNGGGERVRLFHKDNAHMSK